jgi:hypothetical protein
LAFGLARARAASRREGVATVRRARRGGGRVGATGRWRGGRLDFGREVWTYEREAKGIIYKFGGRD